MRCVEMKAEEMTFERHEQNRKKCADRIERKREEMRERSTIDAKEPLPLTSLSPKGGLIGILKIRFAYQLWCETRILLCWRG